MSQSPGFLSLPREIRDDIYHYLVVKPTNTITMLENHDCFQNEVSAAQPAVSRVNKQIRIESLPMFYKSNTFLAELSSDIDLDTAKSWLAAIGNVNAGCIRRLALCGWTQVTLVHRTRRLWIRAAFDLKDRSLEIQGNEATADEQRHVIECMQGMSDCYRAMVDATDGTGRRLDIDCLSTLMEKFHDMCIEHS